MTMAELTQSARQSESQTAYARQWGTYVINLRDATERFAFVSEQLNRLEIPFTRIEAVDGRTLTFPVPEVSRWSYFLLHGRELHRSEVGCYLSHIKAIDAFLATDLRYCLILEDDAYLSDDVVELIDAAILRHDDWDVLRLSSVNNGRRFIVSRSGLCQLGVCFTREKGAGGYMLNRRAAEIFRRKLIPMRLAYDIAFDLEYLAGLKALGVEPLPIGQQTNLFHTQIQTGIKKLPAWRYLTVFPFRAFLEVSRVICRSALYLRLRARHAMLRGNDG